jgi:hypothetical protein
MRRARPPLRRRPGRAMTVTMSYLHPGCAREFTGTEDLAALLHKNSRKLGDADREELGRALSE